MRNLLAIIVSTILTCVYLNVKAQVDESRNFVYFTSDSVLYAEKIRLRADFFNSMKLRVNSQQIPLQEVKFVNTDAGFFATTRRSDIFRKARFAERVIAGRLNLYEQSSYSSGGHFGPSGFGASGFGSAGPV